jgi:hypothetical protein
MSKPGPHSQERQVHKCEASDQISGSHLVLGGGSDGLLGVVLDGRRAGRDSGGTGEGGGLDAADADL